MNTCNMAALPNSLWDVQSFHLSKGMKCEVVLDFGRKAYLFKGKVLCDAGIATNLRIIRKNLIYLCFSNDVFCRAGNTCWTNASGPPSCN
jgi:hypothetical protein